MLLNLHHTFSYLIPGMWNRFNCYRSVFTGFATTDPKFVKMAILTHLHFVTLQLLQGDWWYRNNPMDTSSSIWHLFNVEIPLGKFVEILSILIGESTWKLWHRFDVQISTWIQPSISTKYRWIFLLDFSMSFRHRIDITLCTLFPFYHFLTFSAPETFLKRMWHSAESM